MTQRIWGIHAGKLGDADNIFSKEKSVGLGWADMGDLSNIKQAIR